MIFTIARIISAILLFVALGKHSYSYYVYLRFIICGVSIYGIYFSRKLQNINWAWTFGIVAILFNPIVPIHLNRDLWAIIDVAVAVIFLFSINRLKIPASIDDKS